MDKSESNQKCSFKQSVADLFRGMQLLTVQCSICLFVIIAVLCMRWMGGDLFDNIASLYRQAMLDDTLFTAVEDTFRGQTQTVSAMNAQASPKTIVAPLEHGVITSEFGYRDGVLHEGVDIAKEEGTPLKAMMDGTVTVAEFDENGYGHYVVIECNDEQKYLYAQCQRLTVDVGETVKAGDVLGFVGNTGRSSGSHLHFEWIYRDQPIDPMQILPKVTYV